MFQFSNSIVRLGLLNNIFRGILCSSGASVALKRPGKPEAPSECPMLVLTELT